MRYKKVLLVQAKYDSVFSNILPAGIGYLSEFLSANSVENDVFDLNVKKNTEKKLHNRISEFEPDIIGYSMMSLNYKYNYGIINRLKRAFPGVVIAAGGAHISTMREEVLRGCEGIDCGVVLEGEYTFLELIKGDSDKREIKGLLHRDGDAVVFNGERPFIQDLDSLPYPRYGKFNRRDYSTQVSIFSSRGCPFECIYCPTKLAIGKRFVTRSPKSVVDEIEYYYDLGFREFSFRDDNFTLIKDRVYEICAELEKRRFNGLYLMCDSGLRADKVDYKLLARMKEVGFKMLGIGVESGDDEILKVLKKGATVADMENAIKIACELGYIVELFLLIGSPTETWRDFEKTVRLAIRYPVMIASFYHLLPYPNTELFDFVKKNGYLLREPEEYLNDGSQRRNTPFFATPEFPYDLRVKAFRYAYKMTSAHIKRARRIYARSNTYEKFRRAGFPDMLSTFLAKVYTTGFLYDNIFSSRWISNLKQLAKRRGVAHEKHPEYIAA